MSILFAVIYALSLMICAITVYLSIERGCSYPVKSFWFNFPFGLGYSSAPAIAGFSVFPIINTMIAISVITWTFFEMKNRSMTLSEFIDGK